MLFESRLMLLYHYPSQKSTSFSPESPDQRSTGTTGAWAESSDQERSPRCSTARRHAPFLKFIKSKISRSFHMIQTFFKNRLTFLKK